MLQSVAMRYFSIFSWIVKVSFSFYKNNCFMGKPTQHVKSALRTAKKIALAAGSSVAIGAYQTLQREAYNSGGNASQAFLNSVKRKLSFQSGVSGGAVKSRKMGKGVMYTPTSKGGRRKRVTTGRAAGFIARGKKRPSRNVGIIQKNVRLGVSKSFEYGTVSATTNARIRYIGHSSASVTQMREVFWMAFVKFIALRMGIPFNTWDDEIYHVQTGDSFTLTYNPTPVGSGAVFQDESAACNSASTWRDLATFFNVNIPQTKQVRFIRLEFIPGLTVNAEPTRLPWKLIRLEYASISIDCKSALKIQNRSVTVAADNEANDIDNVPLVGRSYEGNGMGPVFRKSKFLANTTGVENNYSFASDKYAVIDGTEYLAGSPVRELAEPPLPMQLYSCTASGKVRMQPGDVKTSLIMYHLGGKLDNVWNKLGAFNDPDYSLPKVQGSFGKYRLYAVEKMVDCIAPSAENAIRIGIECQVDVSATVRARDSTFTSPEYATFIYTPPA